MWWDFLLDIALPRSCVGCKKKGVSLCAKCLDAFPLALHTGEFSDALYDYNHPVLRRAIWRLKYYGDRTLANIFGTRMAEEYLEEHTQIISRLSYGSTIFLVPVPSTKRRYFERGYNQAELIARVMTERYPCTWKVADILYRTKDNKRQALIKDRKGRKENMSNIIAVKDSTHIQGQVCIIVDDVITSGATMNACREVLVNAGSPFVRGIAIAHGEKIW